jgi:pyoverdine/dityrosine biosynthesis protein Dit1
VRLALAAALPHLAASGCHPHPWRPHLSNDVVWRQYACIRPLQQRRVLFLCALSLFRAVKRHILIPEDDVYMVRVRALCTLMAHTVPHHIHTTVHSHSLQGTSYKYENL